MVKGRRPPAGWRPFLFVIDAGSLSLNVKHYQINIGGIKITNNLSALAAALNKYQREGNIFSFYLVRFVTP